MQVKEVIIVEGKADQIKVQQAVKADVIETNGSAIPKHTLEQIKHAQKKRGVIIFTDPDYAGQRIRQIIQRAVPGCKHAFLTKEQATAKHRKTNLGIENATLENIRNALKSVYEVQKDSPKSTITKAELIRLGLIGQPESNIRRKKLGEYLKIGYPNGKQLLNRLAMFQITIDELLQAMKKIDQEGSYDE